MPITDDQRAMLQLLLQRGQSYAEIASLLGLEVEQVQARARAALTEIGGEDPDREVSLTDYLLGQADPIGRADAARQLQSDLAARDLAQRLATQLRVLAPGAELPELPSADSGAVKRAEPPAPLPEPAGDGGATSAVRRPPGGLAPTLSRSQRQAIAGLLGGGILIVVVVLIVIGAFSGGGGGGSADNGSANRSSGSQATNAQSNAGEVAQALLKPQDNSGAVGKAVFRFVRSGGQDVPILQVIAAGLQPTSQGKSYFIWLYRNNRVALFLGQQKVGRDGRLSGATPLQATAYQALQRGAFNSVDVSLSSVAAYRSEVKRAQQTKTLPRYTGTSVLRGRISGSPSGSQSGDRAPSG